MATDAQIERLRLAYEAQCRAKEAAEAESGGDPATLEHATGEWEAARDAYQDAQEEVMTHRDGPTCGEEESTAPQRETQPTVGAWCGATFLADPGPTIEAAVRLGLRRLDLMINELSKARKATPFELRDEERIERAVEQAQDRGLQVHFTSWIMPHRTFIARAADTLIPLCQRLRIASLLWDAEEPWTQAEGAQSYESAARQIASDFAPLRCRMGVTGIGYANVAKLKPLIRVCDYMVPQAYSTTSSGIDPRTGPGRLIRRWRESFGGVEVCAGLAAYRQDGIPGYTEALALQSALRSVLAERDVDTVVYWHVNDLLRSSVAAKVVGAIHGPAPLVA